jgi:acid phosphatase
MAPNLGRLALLAVALLASACISAEAEWSVLKQLRHGGSRVGISVENYCTGWRANVEVNNIRGFEAVPEECIASVRRYMTSSLQYKTDVLLATEECTLYLTYSFTLAGDGRDAWIFDVDETLLSTLPFYQNHQYGAEKTNATLLEEWMQEAKAPALDHVLCLYKQIRSRGLKIFLLSSRREHLRAATAKNLVAVGYHGWTDLLLRSPDDDHKPASEFKAEQRKKLVGDGYRVWAVVSSQWSALFGDPAPLRIFKLPNPLYYEV